jgi:hypothetical protein
LGANCLIWTNFRTGIAINTGVGDGGLFSRRQGNGSKWANLNAQATSNTGSLVNDHGLNPFWFVIPVKTGIYINSK